MTEARSVQPLDHRIDAVVGVPGSKSVTIRALACATLARGTSTLIGPLVSDDTSVAVDAFRSLGADIAVGDGEWSVTGTSGGLRAPEEEVDAGASGLTARIVLGLAPLVPGAVTVVGRERLPERPMTSLVTVLEQLGLAVTHSNGTLPIRVEGLGVFPSGRLVVSVSDSTQFASALLIASPMAGDQVQLEIEGLAGSSGYLDVTLETMSAFGAELTRHGVSYVSDPTGYRAARYAVPPDASAAVYPMLAAAITGGRVTVPGLRRARIQPDYRIVGLLEAMGCEVGGDDEDVWLEGPDTRLEPMSADLSESPDGALALAVACLAASGSSRLSGLHSLVHKESDRLRALANEIERLGGTARIEGDSLLITPAPVYSGVVDSHGDHRVAMAFAPLGLRHPGIAVDSPDVVSKTWPGFWEMLETL